MSISSCPRCAQQVSLPAGVSEQAQVRCPHCKAQYALADALVNAPPLLEIVEASAFGGEAELAAPADSWPSEASSLVAEPPAEFDLERSSGEALLGEASMADDMGPEAEFAAEANEADDLAAAEHDTEVEDMSRASEPLADETPSEAEPLDVTGPDELSLDFGAPLEMSAEAALDSDELISDELNSDEAELPSEAAEADLSLDFARTARRAIRSGARSCRLRRRGDGSRLR